MSWSAGSAGAVAENLIKEFGEIRERTGIEVTYGAEVLGIVPLVHEGAQVLCEGVTGGDNDLYWNSSRLVGYARTSLADLVN